MSRSLRSLGVAALVVLAGCESVEPTVPPLAPPRVATVVHHHAGSPLGGSSENIDIGTAASALAVRVTFFAVERLPDPFLGSLAAQARLTVDLDDERPLAAAGTLAARGLAGPVQDPRAFDAALHEHGGRVSAFATLHGALPVGVTASFECARDVDGRTACEPLHERFSVHVFRDAAPVSSSIQVAVELEDTHEPPCAEGQAKRVRPDRELTCLDARGLGAFAVVVRSPFHGDEPAALAALIEVSPAPDASSGATHADAFAACAADLARDAIFAKMRATCQLAPAPRPVDPCAATLGSLQQASEQRKTLLSLARGGHAPLAEGIALAADDDTVAAVAKNAGDGSAWALERAAIAALEARASGEDAPAELTALIARRAGAAERGTFFALAARARSLDELERLVVSENLDLLEDAAPALRVRAFEWLRARGEAPEGYDPLGPAAERRKALEAVAASRHTGD